MLSMGEMEEIAHMLADEFDLRDKWGRQKSERNQGHKFFGIQMPCCNNRKVESMHLQRTTIW